MALFDLAIELVLRHEGGYVNNPRDPGGETKYGISKRSYPRLDIKALTREQAVEIYHRDYWVDNRYCDLVSDGLAAKVLDIAVNVGAKRANKWLQESARDCGFNVTVDGVMGPRTVAAVNGCDTASVMVGFVARAYRHYRKLSFAKPEFADGWMRRLWDVRHGT